MSEISDMIQRLCPDGVEYRKLGDVCFYEQPTKFIVHSINYSDDYETPVLTAGQSFILGYTNEEDGIYNASNDNPVIIFDDFTGAFKWVNFPFKVKSSAMKMLTSNKEVLLRYVYHYMGVLNYSSSEHTRLWIGTYSNFEIPVPPLEVQRKIVEVLDNFSELTAELTAELEARKKQYEYYRDNLLNFSQIAPPNSVKWMKLGEIGDVKMCKRVMKHQTNTEYGIPFYKIGTFGKTADAFISQELFNELKNSYSYPKYGDILISASGTIGRTVVYNGEDAYYQDSNIVWIDNDESIALNSYLKIIYQVIEWKVEGGTIKRLYNDNIKNTVIPIPPLSEQERIVSILDRFEALTTDLTSGLPAEIKARQQQYEYYRDQLLTFKRAN